MASKNPSKTATNFFDDFLSPQVGSKPLRGLLEMVERDFIDPWPNQPRAQPRTAQQIEGLRDSILAAHATAKGLGGSGIEQPLTVRPHPDAAQRKKGRYMLVDGEGRYLATADTPVQTLPCLIRELDEEAAWEVASVGGIQRQEYAPLDEAGIVQALLDGKNAEKKPLSIREVAKKLGKDRGWVQNRVEIAKLSRAAQNDPAKAALLELLSLRNDSLSHVLLLATVADETLRAALLQSAKEGASVAQLRAAIEKTALSVEQVAPLVEQVAPLVEQVAPLVEENATPSLSLRNDSEGEVNASESSEVQGEVSLRNDNKGAEQANNSSAASPALSLRNDNAGRSEAENGQVSLEDGLRLAAGQVAAVHSQVAAGTLKRRQKLALRAVISDLEATLAELKRALGE